MAAGSRIILTGASGLVGKALTVRLEQEGYQVVPIKWRDAAPANFDVRQLEGATAVIHLAGEKIVQRWTPSARERILGSRKEGTTALAETLAKLEHKPRCFISMSGLNRYGSSRHELLDENSPVKIEGFLSEVAEAWENATAAAESAGIRTIHLRTGMVLAASGGALKAMLPAFRLGLGGPLGPGTQRLSWIRLGDLVDLIIWVLAHESCRGPLNAVAPQVVTQAGFARALGHALRRPAILPLPAWLISLLFGALGRETILADLAASPARALEGGFKFKTPGLAEALPLALGE